VARAQLNDFGQLGFALDQREHAAFVSSTDNGIALPVSQTGFARDNGRTLSSLLTHATRPSSTSASVRASATTFFQELLKATMPLFPSEKTPTE